MTKQKAIIEYQAELASDPTTPSGGYSVIYPKSDGKWYAKNSAGVVTEITNVATSGPVLGQQSKTISADSTIAAGNSAILAGPIKINSGIRLVIASGGRLVIR